MIDRLKSVCGKIGAAAIWLWHLPPVRSVIATNIIRIAGGGAIGSIIVAIADGLANGG
ncbi:hypothetical protein HH800_07620 [Sphingobium yanoikuyae]|uniref:Uncharacterized protein n=1 Tax=Sphingobium yanoikuyae TaxID=13690 RepID=A0A6M4G4B8_SPHYA|nr:hypothetical protein [Sphingobium yanoikuyae]QJR02081.1 hypothetical protein HH800_07620 [Sphingobium yanoikuyae]